MNTFLRINAGVAYYHGKLTLGDVGLEGSKPGAAAAGVMLANRVEYSFCFCDSAIKVSKVNTP